MSGAVSDDLTPRQAQVLALWAESPISPSYREVGSRLGMTPSSAASAVSDHVHALIKKGYLTKRDKKARSVTLTPKARTRLGIKRNGINPTALDQVRANQLINELHETLNDMRQVGAEMMKLKTELEECLNK